MAVAPNMPRQCDLIDPLSPPMLAQNVLNPVSAPRLPGRGQRALAIAALVLLPWLTAAHVRAAEPVPASRAVIGFDPSELDEQGLEGPPDGKRALDYELCIPAGEQFTAEVGAIDASAQLYPGARGRIGCGPGQVLVIGNTHQPDFALVLRRLAELPYVERIERTWFE